MATIVAFTVTLGCTIGQTSVDLRHATRLGPTGAPVEVVIFSDFQCPFCRRAAAELKRIHVSHPGRVKIYFKHFPLKYHAQAVDAACAAEAARLQGRFWKMHDLLFEYASDLSEDIYAEAAASIGLDVERFRADQRSPEVQNRIAADVAEGTALGINGVPFILLNRRPFRGSYADLAEELESHGGTR